MLSGDVYETNRWQRVWVFEAFWEVLFLFVLCTILILWRPTKNNTRYAYSEELSPEDYELAEGESFCSFWCPIFSHFLMSLTAATANSTTDQPTLSFGETATVRTTAVPVQQEPDSASAPAPASPSQPPSATATRPKNPLAGFALLDEEDDDSKLD